MEILALCHRTVCDISAWFVYVLSYLHAHCQSYVLSLMKNWKAITPASYYYYRSLNINYVYD